MERRIALKRTSLYVSGVKPSNMIQGAFYNEDCIVYDLEDSVPAAEKDAARLMVYNMLRCHRPKDKYILIRINGIYSEYMDEDLQAAVRCRPDAIRIPKVESAEEVRRVAGRIGEIEREAGIEQGKIELWCNIESYLGVLRAYEIAAADPRVAALALGAEDFTVSMKARRTKPGWEIFFARNMMLMACRAAGVDAVDAVFSDYGDEAGLRADVEMARNLGFDGKTVIHPNQIDIVNSTSRPAKKRLIMRGGCSRRPRRDGAAT